VLQPKLPRRADIQALIRRQNKLLPEARAAQLRQGFCASVATIYLLGDVIRPLRKREAGRCVMVDAWSAFEVCATTKNFDTCTLSQARK
jgi:hypothetical protein